MLGLMRPRSVTLRSIDLLLVLHGIIVLVRLHRIIIAMVTAFDRIIVVVSVHRLDVAIGWHKIVAALDLHKTVLATGVQSLVMTVRLCWIARAMWEIIGAVADSGTILALMLVAMGVVNLLTLPIPMDVRIILTVIKRSIPSLGLRPCIERRLPHRQSVRRLGLAGRRSTCILCQRPINTSQSPSKDSNLTDRVHEVLCGWPVRCGSFTTCSRRVPRGSRGGS